MKKLFATLVSLIVCSGYSGKTIKLNDSNHVIIKGALVQNEILLKSQELKADDTLYVVLDTIGGSVVAGNLIIDTLNSVPQKIETITIFAASMGYLIVQSMEDRHIIPTGQLISHRMRVGGLSGQVPGELNTRLEHIEKISKILSKRSADRVGLTIERYEKLIFNEFWTFGSQAVESKHADDVVLIQCDVSLMSEKSMEVRSLLGTFDVTFSKCPLIRAPLSISRSEAPSTPVEDIVLDEITEMFLTHNKFYELKW